MYGDDCNGNHLCLHQGSPNLNKKHAYSINYIKSGPAALTYISSNLESIPNQSSISID